MRRRSALVFAVLYPIMIGSCAGAAAAIARSDEHDVHEKNVSVDAITRPDARAASGGASDLLLPEPASSRREVERALKEYAARLKNACAVWIQGKAQSRVKTTPRTDKTAETKKEAPQAKKRDDAPPVATPRTPIAETPVRTPTAEPDAAAGGEAGTHTIFSRLGDDVEISFKEKGWLLLEMPPAGSGLSFVSRQIDEGKTLFKFRSRKIGDYLLPFHYQDQAKGAVRRRTILVKVLSQKDFDAAVGGRNGGADGDDRMKRRNEAARLLAQGDEGGALRAYLDSYTEGDPELNELIASLAFKQKDFAHAIRYWEKNLAAGEDLRDKAIIGLVRASLAAGERRVLASVVRPLLTVRSHSIEEELALLIDAFSDGRESALEYELLQEYLKRYPTGVRLDMVYFHLGRLYELSRPFLDFKKSREYYTLVVKLFPESRFFMPAKKRIEYLDRHYFRVE